MKTGCGVCFIVAIVFVGLVLMISESLTKKSKEKNEEEKAKQYNVQQNISLKQKRVEEKTEIEKHVQNVEKGKNSADNGVVDFLSYLRQKGVKQDIVKNCQVEGDKLIITIDNFFFELKYQKRLQVAQTLWGMWAEYHSPKNPDQSRIRICDIMGNEVGGSRAMGGSLIWVQEK